MFFLRNALIRWLWLGFAFMFNFTYFYSLSSNFARKKKLQSIVYYYFEFCISQNDRFLFKTRQNSEQLHRMIGPRIFPFILIGTLALLKTANCCPPGHPNRPGTKPASRPIMRPIMRPIPRSGPGRTGKTRTNGPKGAEPAFKVFYHKNSNWTFLAVNIQKFLSSPYLRSSGIRTTTSSWTKGRSPNCSHRSKKNR